LQQWLEQCITPDDYLIVVLTHPNRYWFVEDKPDLTNPSIVDFDKQVSRDVADAIASYVLHIQRPPLDTIHLLDRLGLLAYYVSSRNLRKPIVIKAFEQSVLQAGNFKELNWATGVLTEVQFNEFENKYAHDQALRGIDVRYNHLCLSNHVILADKIFAALMDDTPVDLTTGFIQNLLNTTAMADPEFGKKELNMEDVAYGLAHRDGSSPVVSWRDRIRGRNKT
jgi:hypothetical protein